MTSQCFPFMTLPTEVRLGVYENITFDTRQHVTTHRVPYSGESDYTRIIPVFLIRKSLQCGFLASCKLINQEARSIIGSKLRQLEQEPICIQTDHDVLLSMTRRENSSPKVLQNLCKPCLAYLEHNIGVSRPSAQQPHIEIAINRRTEPIPLVNAGWIWIRFLICAQQYGISCVLLYQDIIHCCHLGRRQVPGLQAWAYLQSLQLQRPNRARPDSIMKIEELETGDWAKLVESWSEA
jgi:hypothetical protein